MRDYVTGFIFGMVCLLIGTALLYDAVSVRDPMQTETMDGRGSILWSGAFGHPYKTSAKMEI